MPRDFVVAFDLLRVDFARCDFLDRDFAMMVPPRGKPGCSIADAHP
jgi:hypothetical protein